MNKVSEKGLKLGDARLQIFETLYGFLSRVRQLGDRVAAVDEPGERLTSLAKLSIVFEHLESQPQGVGDT